MISEELLSEVFNQEVRFIKYVANNTYEIHFEKPIRLKYIIINIYELAHKCKEWAKSKEFIIHSSPTQKIEYTAIAQHFDLNKFYYRQNQFHALSEYEAIFKACEWLLDIKED